MHLDEGCFWGEAVGVASILTLDRGNTTLDCQLHGERPVRERLDPDSAGGLERMLDGRRPDRAVGLTVVPGGLELARRVLAGIGVELHVAGVDLPCPLRVDYREPETLGVDRWVAALAAHALFGDACVVDLGSAVTVDLVESRGSDIVFRGGAIAPGLKAMASGLQQVAPALPRASVADPVRVPATSSEGAVTGGVVFGYCGMVERLVADVRAGANGQPAVVLTGGDAHLYQRHGRLAANPVDDLVHQGLVRLAGYHLGASGRAASERPPSPEAT